jgi:kynurenine formamidase
LTYAQVINEQVNRDSNNGRWGADDERGAANLIDAEKVQDAAAVVRRGRVYPLGREIPDASRFAHRGRAAVQHLMTLDGGDYAAGARLPGDVRYADDTLIIPTHGTTHVDALCHFWAGDTLYNGHPSTKVRSYGATRCGIENLAGVATRGLLLDFPALLGVDHLEGGYAITAAEVERCLAAAELKLEPGDCVLVRTGWPAMLDRDEEAYHASAPGIGVEAALMLARADVALVAADTMAVEVENADGSYDGGSPAPPVHKILIRDFGVYMLELLDLDELAADGVRELMFVLAPLRVRGGTGSPVNPIAIA